MKSVYMPPIKFAAHFERAHGSYYDFVAECYTSSKEIEDAVTMHMMLNDWRVIQPSNTSLIIYEKDRHIVRCFRVWEGPYNGN